MNTSPRTGLGSLPFPRACLTTVPVDTIILLRPERDTWTGRVHENKATAPLQDAPGTLPLTHGFAEAWVCRRQSGRHHVHTPGTKWAPCSLELPSPTKHQNTRLCCPASHPAATDLPCAGPFWLVIYCPRDSSSAARDGDPTPPTPSPTGLWLLPSRLHCQSHRGAVIQKGRKKEVRGSRAGPGGGVTDRCRLPPTLLWVST
jgi:hypothetical protein